MSSARYVTGQQGEQMAEGYLLGLGMVCLARNYRGLDGEIDLVMQEGDILVMVEVKSRPRGRAGEGLMAVTPAK